MAPRDLQTLRSLLETASSVDRERTRRTREAFLAYLQDRGIDADMSSLLISFTAAHDDLEAAIMKRLPAAAIETKRIRCLALIESHITHH
jgi:hypothetical protein